MSPSEPNAQGIDSRKHFKAEPCSEFQPARRLFTSTPVQELADADVGRFFDLPVDLVPEAFQAHYRSAAARAETVVDKGGCKGVQARSQLGAFCAGLPESASIGYTR